MEFRTECLIFKELSHGYHGDIHRLHSLPQNGWIQYPGDSCFYWDRHHLVTNLAGPAGSHTRNFLYFLYWIKGKRAVYWINRFKYGQTPLPDCWSMVIYIHPNNWAQGYETEALKKMLEFGFTNFKLHRIEAVCEVENGSSLRVLEKAGMTREERKREILPIREGPIGWHYFYPILETGFWRTFVINYYKTISPVLSFLMGVKPLAHRLSIPSCYL